MQYLSTILFLTVCFVTNAYALIPTMSMMTAEAQTPIHVPYSTANFLWDAPTSGSTPTYYLLNCGAADVNIPAPATSKPVRDVVAGAGTYTCTLKAGNAGGLSPAAPFPIFTADVAPNAPTGLQVQ